jgi:hypothetical protein
MFWFACHVGPRASQLLHPHSFELEDLPGGSKCFSPEVRADLALFQQPK